MKKNVITLDVDWSAIVGENDDFCTTYLRSNYDKVKSEFFSCCAPSQKMPDNYVDYINNKHKMLCNIMNYCAIEDVSTFHPKDLLTQTFVNNVFHKSRGVVKNKFPNNRPFVVELNDSCSSVNIKFSFNTGNNIVISDNDKNLLKTDLQAAINDVLLDYSIANNGNINTVSNTFTWEIADILV